MRSKKCAVHNQRITLSHLEIHVFAACGQKFGECSTDIHVLRLCECHLASANCIKFKNITIRFLDVSSFD